jgi:hypothetical protein
VGFDLLRLVGCFGNDFKNVVEICQIEVVFCCAKRKEVEEVFLVIKDEVDAKLLVDADEDGVGD